MVIGHFSQQGGFDNKKKSVNKVVAKVISLPTFQKGQSLY